MIRTATIDDLDVIVEMCEKFFAETYHSNDFEFDIGTTTEVLIHLIENCTVFISGDDAVFAAFVYPSLFNKYILVALEVLWWIKPEKRNLGTGIRLLKYAESHLKHSGVKSLTVGNLDNDSIGDIYRKMGYIKREESYVRVL